MSTNALKGQGVTLGIGAGTTPETYTSIVDVVGWSGPDETTGTIDTTDMSESTASKIANGIVDGGRVTADLNARPAESSQSQLRTDMAAGTLRSFRLTLTDTGATTITFNAYVVGISPSGRRGEHIALSVTLDVSGAVTYA